MYILGSLNFDAESFLKIKWDILFEILTTLNAIAWFVERWIHKFS